MAQQSHPASVGRMSNYRYAGQTSGTMVAFLDVGTQESGSYPRSDQHPLGFCNVEGRYTDATESHGVGHDQRRNETYEATAQSDCGRVPEVRSTSGRSLPHDRTDLCLLRAANK